MSHSPEERMSECWTAFAVLFSNGEAVIGQMDRALVVDRHNMHGVGKNPFQSE